MEISDNLLLLSNDIVSNRIDLKALLLCTGLSLIALLLFWLLFKKRRGVICYVLLFEYLWLLLCFTVICRKKGELEQFFPLPFYDYGHLALGVL